MHFKLHQWTLVIVFSCLALVPLTSVTAVEDLPNIIDKIRPSIVGVGTYQKLRRPPNRLSATGFVVGDGNLIITNAHVVSQELNSATLEQRVVFVGRGKKAAIRKASVLQVDKFHDLALLKIDGSPLTPLTLNQTAIVREGQSIAFTGFPIGIALGLYPVTHQGIVSAISPIAIPQLSLRSTTSSQLRKLREPFDVIQLDATAYPGNSGSPVFDRNTGIVIGVVNSVLVKESKENVLKDPSAITYAIPARFALALISGNSK